MREKRGSCDRSDSREAARERGDRREEKRDVKVAIVTGGAEETGEAVGETQEIERRDSRGKRDRGGCRDRRDGWQ